MENHLKHVQGTRVGAHFTILKSQLFYGKKFKVLLNFTIYIFYLYIIRPINDMTAFYDKFSFNFAYTFLLVIKDLSFIANAMQII